MKFQSTVITLLSLLVSARSEGLRGRSMEDSDTIAMDSSDDRRLQQNLIFDLVQYARARCEGRYNAVATHCKDGWQWDGLDHSSIEVTYNDIVIGDWNKQELEPSSFRGEIDTNDGWAERTTTLSGQTTVTREVTASVTAGFKYQQEFTTSVGVEKVASVTSKQSLEISLSQTTTSREEMEETFKWERQLVIPPYTRVEMNSLVSNVVTSPDFTAEMTIRAKEVSPTEGWPRICYNLKKPRNWPAKDETMKGCFRLQNFFLAGGSEYQKHFHRSGNGWAAVYVGGGKMTGTGGTTSETVVTYTCLEPRVLNSDGDCVRPSELEETGKQAKVESGPYKTERFSLNGNGDLLDHTVTYN